VTRRTRTLRYGASVAVALIGVACGVVIPGAVGGTAATVLIGIGLVGVVSLVFYEVGLTEDRDRDRDRAAQARRQRVEEDPRQSGLGEEDPRESGLGEEDPRHPRGRGTPAHDAGRMRRLERGRGQRRRLR
jgi:hypothetical protein